MKFSFTTTMAPVWRGLVFLGLLSALLSACNGRVISGPTPTPASLAVSSSHAHRAADLDSSSVDSRADEYPGAYAHSIGAHHPARRYAVGDRAAIRRDA